MFPVPNIYIKWYFQPVFKLFAAIDWCLSLKDRKSRAR
jgi:hypothetical protein